MSGIRAFSKEKQSGAKTFESAFTLSKHAPTATPPRWICNHHSSHSDIEAYIVGENQLEIIAHTKQNENVSARANADLIVNAVNDYEKHLALIGELLSALELCLDSDSLSWEAEQEAELVCARARQGL